MFKRYLTAMLGAISLAGLGAGAGAAQAADISGAGATFPAPVYAKWAETYRAQLSPDDFYLPRLRYVDPAPYTEAEFERARRFMIEWDLLAPDATYDKLVANVI